MSGNDSSCAAPVQKSDAVEYREIPGCPGYRVGSDGSVWSRWKRVGYGRPKSGTYVVLGDVWKMIKVHLDNKGYCRVELRNAEHKRVNRGVHSLLLECFIGPAPHGMVALHFPDPNPSNNDLSNLRWGTMVENAADRDVHGTTPRGENQGNSKLTEADVRQIRKMKSDGITCKRIADLFGVSKSNVQAIVRRRSWNHVA